MDEEASIILGDAIAFCQRDGQDARLINMLGQSRAISLTEDTLTIEAPSRFAIAQLKKHQPTIEAYLEEIAFAPIALDIVAPQGAATESAAATAPATAPAASPAAPASAGDVPTIEHQHSDVSRETMAPLPTAAATSTNAPVTHMPIAHDAAAGADSGIAIKNTLSADDFRRMMNQMKGGAPTKSTQAATPASPMPAPTVPAEQNTDGAPLAANSKFTFENFVYGPENSHAYRSALKFAALADERGTCTSLFIYGKSGLGKTHLLYAIANVIRKNDRNAKIVYIKGDDFINEFIELIRAGRGSEFRAKYREADLLLVDDVQFVAGKEQVQNEFFHTFNNLYESGKQIVLTSDRPPSEMTLLDDRLRTRFEWGLLADVTPPDFETRLAIVKNKAVALGMDLPDKIASYIAENVTANVRQLEGTVNKILAYKDLLGNEADEATVTRAMQDILKKSNEYIPTPDNILDYISKYYGIEKEIICGQQRVKDAVAARQIAMYLIRSMTNLPVVEIGKVFDNRDHSTVLYSLKQVEKQMKKDPSFAETVKEIKTNINNRH